MSFISETSPELRKTFSIRVSGPAPPHHSPPPRTFLVPPETFSPRLFGCIFSTMEFAPLPLLCTPPPFLDMNSKRECPLVWPFWPFVGSVSGLFDPNDMGGGRKSGGLQIRLWSISPVDFKSKPPFVSATKLYPSELYIPKI